MNSDDKKTVDNTTNTGNNMIDDQRKMTTDYRIQSTSTEQTPATNSDTTTVADPTHRTHAGTSATVVDPARRNRIDTCTIGVDPDHHHANDTTTVLTPLEQHAQAQTSMVPIDYSGIRNGPSDDRPCRLCKSPLHWVGCPTCPFHKPGQTNGFRFFAGNRYAHGGGNMVGREKTTPQMQSQTVSEHMQATNVLRGEGGTRSQTTPITETQEMMRKVVAMSARQMRRTMQRKTPDPRSDQKMTQLLEEVHVALEGTDAISIELMEKFELAEKEEQQQIQREQDEQRRNAQQAAEDEKRKEQQRLVTALRETMSEERRRDRAYMNEKMDAVQQELQQLKGRNTDHQHMRPSPGRSPAERRNRNSPPYSRSPSSSPWKPGGPTSSRAYKSRSPAQDKSYDTTLLMKRMRAEYEAKHAAEKTKHDAELAKVKKDLATAKNATGKEKGTNRKPAARKGGTAASTNKSNPTDKPTAARQKQGDTTALPMRARRSKRLKEYTISKILERRVVTKSNAIPALEYLIEWEEGGTQQWKNVAELNNCLELIKDYETARHIQRPPDKRPQQDEIGERAPGQQQNPLSLVSPNKEPMKEPVTTESRTATETDTQQEQEQSSNGPLGGARSNQSLPQQNIERVSRALGLVTDIERISERDLSQIIEEQEQDLAPIGAGDPTPRIEERMYELYEQLFEGVPQDQQDQTDHDLKRDTTVTSTSTPLAILKAILQAMRHPQ